MNAPRGARRDVPLTPARWAGALLAVALLALAGAGAWRLARPPRAAAPAPEPPPIPPAWAWIERAPEVPPELFEYRGVWVATVDNIDWPSRKDLPSDAQREEMLAIVSMARDLRLNTIVLQVRPSCDAIYPSPYEPWSEYLTGLQGRAPEPPWDPLAEWIEAAHREGLQLHAWFNPFRARHFKATGPDAPSHVSHAMPDLVRTYGTTRANQYLWLDPGDARARDLALRAVLDVVERYDVDGVHIDDYFYPYPIDARPFPDDATFAEYQGTGGTLARADWRRANIDDFVQRLYREAKGLKPWVRVGISPFGIWRPGHPEGVRGMDAHDVLFADARRWANEGWLDYLAPQLYWAVDAPGQPFLPLLDWWIAQNTGARHVVVGLNTSKIPEPSPAPSGVPPAASAGFAPSEIERQITLARTRPGSMGSIQFSAKPLLQDRAGVRTLLREGVFDRAAIPPAMAWTPGGAPPAPACEASIAVSGVDCSWAPADGSLVSGWIVAWRAGAEWTFEALPGVARSHQVRWSSVEPPAAVGFAVFAVDRAGRVSPPGVPRDPRTIPGESEGESPRARKNPA